MTPSTTLIARLVLPEASAARAAADTLGELFDFDAAAIAMTEAADRSSILDIYLGGEREPAEVQAQIAAALGETIARTLTFTTVEPRDWVAQSLAGLKPVPAARFVVHGAHDRARIPPHRTGIEIEAALAFGTGHHGTTRGCLLAFDAWLKRRAPGGRPVRVLDVGTGTGVLAIAAAKALRGKIVASDIDRQSVRVAHANAQRNAAGAFVTTVVARGLTHPAVARRRPYAVVFANILLPVLRPLAVPIRAAAAAKATVILSGLLPAQANAALAVYRAVGFALARRLTVDGWTTLVLRPAGRPRRT